MDSMEESIVGPRIQVTSSVQMIVLSPSFNPKSTTFSILFLEQLEKLLQLPPFIENQWNNQSWLWGSSVFTMFYSSYCVREMALNAVC